MSWLTTRAEEWKGRHGRFTNELTKCVMGWDMKIIHFPGTSEFGNRNDGKFNRSWKLDPQDLPICTVLPWMCVKFVSTYTYIWIHFQSLTTFPFSHSLWEGKNFPLFLFLKSGCCRQSNDIPRDRQPPIKGERRRKKDSVKDKILGRK